MRILLAIILGLCFTTNAESTPSNTMSITPAAVDAATIEASDENTRNNTITTTFNNHDHTDISQTANTLQVGDGTAGNKTIEAGNADGSQPYIRYDDTNNVWTVTQDGSNAQTIVTMTGTSVSGHILPQSPIRDDYIVWSGNSWSAVSTTYFVGSFTRDTSTASNTQTVSGVPFKPKAVLFYSVQGGSREFGIGFDSAGVEMNVYDDPASANTYGVDTSGSSIRLEQGVSDLVTADVGSFLDDGFNVDWVKTGSPTGTATIIYLAIK